MLQHTWAPRALAADQILNPGYAAHLAHLGTPRAADTADQILKLKCDDCFQTLLLFVNPRPSTKAEGVDSFPSLCASVCTKPDEVTDAMLAQDLLQVEGLYNYRVYLTNLYRDVDNPEALQIVEEFVQLLREVKGGEAAVRAFLTETLLDSDTKMKDQMELTECLSAVEGFLASMEEYTMDAALEEQYGEEIGQAKATTHAAQVQLVDFRRIEAMKELKTAGNN